LQNTYTNAEKLLTAAEELAQTGECKADEIYSVARQLETRVASFAARVEQRRHRLDLAVAFYQKDKEVRKNNFFSAELEWISIFFCF
jgi:triple functional domain protein